MLFMYYTLVDKTPRTLVFRSNCPVIVCMTAFLSIGKKGLLDVCTKQDGVFRVVVDMPEVWILVVAGQHLPDNVLWATGGHHSRYCVDQG